jgi:hypothetical protein
LKERRKKKMTREQFLKLTGGKILEHKGKSHLVIGSVYMGQLTEREDSFHLLCDGKEDISHLSIDDTKVRNLTLATGDTINTIVELANDVTNVSAIVTKRHLDPDSEYSDEGIPFIVDIEEEEEIA